MSDQHNEQNEISTRNSQQFKKFISSNRDYLKEKYQIHFKDILNEFQAKITEVPIHNLVLYLIEIFSLERFQNNKEVSQIINSSIQDNYKQYLMSLDPNETKINAKFDFERFLQILIFIIENNSLFAVQYDTKVIINSENQTQNYSGSKEDINLNIDLNLINQNFEKKKKKSSIQKAQFLKNSFEVENEFEIPDKLPDYQKDRSSQLIKKNSRIIFDFYCRQQMQLGGFITFDRLSQQSSSMSLGKCLTFAKATKIYNNLITRDVLIAKFKRVSEGNRAINFEKFQILLGQFQLLDQCLNERICLTSEDIRKNLKYVKLPFNTKDSAPREKIAIRNFEKKLTGHSGKTGQALKQQIDNKRYEEQRIKKLKQIKNYFAWKQNKSQIISQKDLIRASEKKTKDYSIDLSFIGSIVHPQESDDIYLKGHLIPKLQKQTQKIAKFGKIFETERYKSMDKLTLRKQTRNSVDLQNYDSMDQLALRKQSVILGIRRRVQQLEFSQKQNEKWKVQ